MPESGLAAPGGPLAAARRVHLIGIGGAGMAALASLLLRQGREVSGSDAADSEATSRLAAEGATVFVGHRAEHVHGAEYVVRSSAIPTDNPEVLEAARLGLPSVKHAEAAGELMRGRRGVAVAGTHGKTTTTALVAWLLWRGGVDPLALIGAESVNFGASAVLGDGPMVIEADEFDRRFLAFWPEVAIVTSVEADHLDYFSDLAEIEAVFQEFVDRLPAHGLLVACADEPGASRLRTEARRETYGFAADADWRATDFQGLPGGGSRFRLHHAGRSWPVEWSLLGEHNARNALAAVAVADHFGVGLTSVLAALAEFRGTRRRFETRGRPRGIWVVDDYAHHPTAVATNLRAARAALEESGGTLWAIFQPHTTNRTAALLGDFARSLADAHHALVLPIYRPPGRESAARSVTSEDLVAAARDLGHADVRAIASFDDAVAQVAAGARPGDLVLTLGAGDVTRLADRLARELA